MISRAFISGQIGSALYEENDKLFLLGVEENAIPVECRESDINMFVHFGSEFTSIEGGPLDLNLIQKSLLTSTNSYRALNALIGGMDAELDKETRIISIKAAEELLVSNLDIYNFVRARFLARLLPEGSDIKNAKIHAKDVSASHVEDLYSIIQQSQDIINSVFEIWHEKAPEFFSSTEEIDEAERCLIDIGLFAEMILATSSGNVSGLGKIVFNYGIRNDLKGNYPFIVHLLNMIKNEIIIRFSLIKNKNEFEISVRVQDINKISPYIDGPILRLIDQFSSKKNFARKKISAFERKNKVDIQIRNIKNLIHNNKIHRAKHNLFDLIKFHLEHGEKEHVGKTLCNLAKTCMEANLIEFAEELVKYAFRLGILGMQDVVVRSTNAEILRKKGNLDAAIAEYKTAMAEFPHDVVARCGYAEVLKEKGLLDEALGVYQTAMEEFPQSVFARNGYAEVLKEKGFLDEAMGVYQTVMEDFPQSVVARCGYAEVLKEKGLLDEALGVYQTAMEEFPQSVFARNGYAEVLKEKGFLDEALAEYKTAMAEFPQSVFARCGYAEVLKEKGLLDEALDVYKTTMAEFPQSAVPRNAFLALLILMNKFEETSNYLFKGIPTTFEDYINYHISAMYHLKTDNINKAIEMIEYGFERSPWIRTKNYFATALAFTRIKQKKYDEAEKILSCENIWASPKTACLVLKFHSQLANNKIQEAESTSLLLEDSIDNRVINLKEYISKRYNINTIDTLPDDEIAFLDKQIEEEELFLLLAA